MYYYPRIEDFMRQTKDDHTDLDTCYRLLAEALTPPDELGALPEDEQPNQSPGFDSIPVISQMSE